MNDDRKLPDGKDTAGLSRRAFVLGTATLAIDSVRASTPRAPAQPAAGRIAELTELSATQAVARMTRGEMTAERYAAALLARCSETTALNAFITLEPERVLAQARARDRERHAGGKLGPLFGLPMPIKDSVNTQDYPTSGGTPALRGFRPATDAPVVSALKSAGAIVLGKTNLHELSYGWTSNNLAFGAVHNPYDPARIPGGSSGGTAAAIAARLAPLGVAEDTEGSIRIPAAFCGIAGFRPTTGRYPTSGCVPISSLFDQVGPLARSVADLALFDSVVAHDWSRLPAIPLRGLRLGIVREYWFADLDPQVEKLTSQALSRLRDAGVELIEGSLPDLARLIELTTLPIQNHDVRPALTEYLERYSTGVSFEQLIARASPDIRDIFGSDIVPGGANVLPEGVYTAALQRHLPALRQLYREYFASADVAALVFPASCVPPTLIGEETAVRIGDRELPFEVAVARNIAPGSTAGIPGLVLPVGLTDAGLPVALEFDAPAKADRRLLALGASLERCFGALPAPRLAGSSGRDRRA